ncbi:MAG: D-amino acid aminotransferase [Gammaproteobacteria bacterium]|nr:D-amino acid aminotransferase [Gammaproteobacteria bacterium]
MDIAYFNGDYVPLEQVRVSPLDRGYLLGDGVYEVVPVYSGRLFCIDSHLERLARSLGAVEIRNPHSPSDWRRLLETLVTRNGGGEQSVYFQVTRGVAPRNHAFPANVDPVVFAMTRKMSSRAEPAPVEAVTRTDNRWDRCDIKSIALLPNVLLRQQAVAAGASEAILHKDGSITEGAASNVFVVHGERVRTPPKSPKILAGITRDVVVQLGPDAGLVIEEVEIPEPDLMSADEIWVTSSTMEVSPVIRLNGRPVGSGKAGPIWARLYQQFRRYKLDGAGLRAASSA